MTSRHPDYIRCRRDEREQAHRSAVSFDVSDAKGRVIGYRTMIDREVWVADEASNTSWDKKWVGCEIFRLQPQATRSGVDYGASLNAPIARVAVENPVMHGHARERIVGWVKPQIVQPWWFGDRAFKATGLYLRGLPPLVPTNRLTPPKPGTDEHKAWSMIHRASPGPDRWKVRSKTFPGMAEAWADQFGGYAMESAA